LYRRALAIKEKILGPDHPDVAMTLHNLAALRAAAGAPDEARGLYTRALEIFERALAEAHPKTRACRASYREMLVPSTAISCEQQPGRRNSNASSQRH
jgi:hypothetical protein